MQHHQAFLAIVNDAKTRIQECTVDEFAAMQESGEPLQLIDVREESEFARGRIPGAIHLGKGVIERDIEAAVPNQKTKLVLYCGGGYRSALAADNVVKMGYTQVISMDGGFGGWKESGRPIQTD